MCSYVVSANYRGKIKDVKSNDMEILTKTKKTTNQILEYGEENLEKSFEKEFVPRNSLITDLYQFKHFRSIYNVYLVSLAIFFAKSILFDVLNGNKLSFGTKYIMIGFSDFPYVMVLWLFMLAVTFTTYFVFCFWANIRSKIFEKYVLNGTALKIWDLLWFCGIFVYFFIIVYIPLSVRGVPFAMANNYIIVMEQLRLMMKHHAFIRSNAPKVLAYKNDADVKLKLPTFSNYIYFLFAPTFVYRDNYPRTTKVRYPVVLFLFAEFIGNVFFFSFAGENVVYMYRDFGLVPETWATLTMRVLGMMWNGTLALIIFIYFLLHSWMNLWAEMLKFADRRFYEDWWNATSFREYLRKWNIVVYDYLHLYIYKDIVNHLAPGNKLMGASVVILVSAIAHEFIFAFTIGCFLPIFFVTYFILALPLILFFKANNSVLGNFIFWLGFTIGNCLNAGIYTMEYFARINCPQEMLTVSDYFIPRILNCNGLNLPQI